MSPTAGKVREPIAARPSGEAQAAVRPATVLWVEAFLAGALLGVVAQFLRQIPGPLMSLGASTAPWVTAGFLLAVWGSRGAPAARRAILVATGTMATYLVAWLVSYHLLFVVRESVRFAAGWREAAPWLVAAIPACPMLGAIAALSHRRGLLGDACLAAPLAWSLPDVLGSLSEGWADVAAVEVPVAVFVVLLIRMAMAERPVRPITLLAAAATLGALAVALFPAVRGLIRS